ncbi:MAG TPA: potassium-transporting ATPase subunit KdpC [Candidatus Eremiobacteraceae bacterium]|nr:potassium-transporting ATPase subunit KdpC [Candidatus Eremiobacteraceae bacterium]
MNAHPKDNLLHHLAPAVLFTIVTVIMFGLIYPIAMTLAAQAIFPAQARGAYVYKNGTPIGSDIVGQLWTKPQYFHGRPSAAGNGYDPTSTGGTNLAPTSKKLIDSTKSTLAALRKENPDATMTVPMDLVTSSASGIDPDISPQAAYYQAPRIAKARGMSVRGVDAIIGQNVEPRELGFLGEPRVNVLALNLALDSATPQR